MVYSSQSLDDPAGSNVLVLAVQWLQGTLLGTVATTVAIIAVGTIGFMMLAGRVDWKRGATVVIGCFILFGASSIVAGIRAAVAGGEDSYVPVVSPSTSPLQPAPVPSPAVVYDPYAGAAVPSS